MQKMITGKTNSRGLPSHITSGTLLLILPVPIILGENVDPQREGKWTEIQEHRYSLLHPIWDTCTIIKNQLSRTTTTQPCQRTASLQGKRQTHANSWVKRNVHRAHCSAMSITPHPESPRQQSVPERAPLPVPLANNEVQELSREIRRHKMWIRHFP